MRSPPPEDPSVLDGHSQGDGADEITQAPTPTRTSAPPVVSARPTAGTAPPQSTRVGHPLLSASSRTPRASPAPTAKPTAKAATFDLLGDLGDSMGSESPSTTQNGPPPAVPGNRPTAPPTAAATQLPSLAPVVATAPAKPAQPAPGAGLFDLDFKAPTPTSTAQKPKTSTNDILSLFSTASAPPAYSQPSVSHQQSYQQHTQPQSQQQQTAVFGQAGSYNAPPTVAPQGQAAYATWTGASGVTSPTGGASSTGISSGMANLNMGGADVWGASVPTSQVSGDLAYIGATG